MQLELTLVAILGSLAFLVWLTDRGRDDRYPRRHHRSYRRSSYRRGDDSGGFWTIVFVVIIVIGIIAFLPLIPLP